MVVVLATVLRVNISILHVPSAATASGERPPRAAPANARIVHEADELRPLWVARTGIDPNGVQTRGRRGDVRAGIDVARQPPSFAALQVVTQ